jgi:predicted Zn-dependent protease
MILCGCNSVPITGRKQFNVVPDSYVNAMALQEYNAFLQDKNTKLSTDSSKTAMVQRVGRSIADSVERYLKNNGMADEIANYQWEFNLIESDQKNAWAMPGGKVVIYTGILEVTQNETGLAVVMSHEIAHAVAKHGAERMSQQLVAVAGGVAVEVATEDSENRELFMAAYGVGASVGVLLPYSRTHEKEADRLGMIFMAMAGYDPRETVGFWERMSADKEGEIPEFLSTHPGSKSRVENIERHMPEAMYYYNRVQ